MPAGRIPPRPAAAIRRLLAWYRAHGRDLPWRRTRDPYAIWVSEVMLQQTTVKTAIPYYRRFLARFPTARRLAAARPQAVLKCWEGLGYYSRARNLHAAARLVAARHGGRVPDDPAALRALPGVGPYTAGAILSIAHGRRAPLLDGNVARVLCRYLAIREDPRTPAARERLWAVARRWIDGPSPGDVNQAWMELGATVCTPRAPACQLCPIRSACHARRLGIENLLPARAAHARAPLRRGFAALLRRRDGRVFLARRPLRGLLGGLWGFPGRIGRGARAWTARTAARTLSKAYGLAADDLEGRLAPLAPGVAHAFTHFRLSVDLFVGTLPVDARAAERPDRRWADPARLGRLPLSTLDRKIAQAFADAAAARFPSPAAPSFRGQSAAS